MVNPIIRYRFERIVNNQIADESASQNDATDINRDGCEIFTDTKMGNCLSVKGGQEHYLTIPSQQDPASLTFNIWLRLTPDADLESSLGKLLKLVINQLENNLISGASHKLVQHFTSAIEDLNENNVTSSASATWYFLSASLNENKVSYYLNTNPISSQTDDGNDELESTELESTEVESTEVESTEVESTEVESTEVESESDSLTDCKGRIAWFTLYDQVLTEQEIKTDYNQSLLSRGLGSSLIPVDFALESITPDGSYEPVLYRTDQTAQPNVYLTIRNNDKSGLRLKDFDSDTSQVSYHFQLKFRPGTLQFDKNNANISLIGEALGDSDSSANWGISIQEAPDGIVTVNINQTNIQTVDTDGAEADSSQTDSAPALIPPGSSYRFTITGIYPSSQGGSRTTNVEFNYQNLTFGNTGGQLKGTRLQNLDILSQMGDRNLPITVSILGSNRILNDGKSPNSTFIRITNTSDQSIVFTDGSNAGSSQSRIELDLPGEQQGQLIDWSLSSSAHLNQVQMSWRPIASASGEILTMNSDGMARINIDGEEQGTEKVRPIPSETYNEILAAKAEIESTKEQLDSKGAEIERLDTEIQAFDAEIQDLDTEIQGLNSEIQDLDTELHGLNDEIQGLNDEIQGLNDEIQGLNDEIQGLNDEIQYLNNKQRNAVKEAKKAKYYYYQVNNKYRAANDSRRGGLVVILKQAKNALSIAIATKNSISNKIKKNTSKLEELRVATESKELERSGKLNELERSGKLDELNELNELNELKETKELEKADKLDELNGLKELKELKELENLNELEALNSLFQQLKALTSNINDLLDQTRTDPDTSSIWSHTQITLRKKLINSLKAGDRLHISPDPKMATGEAEQDNSEDSKIFLEDDKGLPLDERHTTLSCEQTAGQDTLWVTQQQFEDDIELLHLARGAKVLFTVGNETLEWNGQSPQTSVDQKGFKLKTSFQQAHSQSDPLEIQVTLPADVLIEDAEADTDVLKIAGHLSKVAADTLISKRTSGTAWKTLSQPNTENKKLGIRCVSEYQLEPGNSLAIGLTNIVSDSPIGTANISLCYYNIPGFWDGKFELELQKSPVTYMQVGDKNRVGINQAIPQAGLDIDDTLLVHNAAKFKDDVHIENNLSVNGDITGEKNLILSGESTVGKTLTIEGNQTDESSNTLNVNGNTEISGNTRISGDATIEGTIHNLGMVPVGGVVMFHETRNQTFESDSSGLGTGDHAGWALCNGSNGTPDLQDRFVMGARMSSKSKYYLSGRKGGPDNHTHRARDGGDSIELKSTSYNSKPTEKSSSKKREYRKYISQYTYRVESDFKNRPKWYALCFIMRIK